MNEKVLDEICDLLKEEVSFQHECQKRKERREIRRRKEEKKAFTIAILAVLIPSMAAVVMAIVFLFATNKDTNLQLVIETEPMIQVMEENRAVPTPTVSPSAPQVNISIQAEDMEVVIVNNGLYCSEGDKLLFEQILAAESYSFWSESDLLSLATVIVNRVKHPDFPDTFGEVLREDRQFATYANGRYKDAVITDECIWAVEAALNGETNLNSDVLWFCTKEYYDSTSDDDFFKSLDHVYTCRNVYFFEE